MAVLLVVVALGLLWRPVLYPGGKAAVLLLDVYAPALIGIDVAAAITPEPRHLETRETIGGIPMRVDLWRPGWGDRHPGLLMVNGATPLGNDNEATRRFALGLARAGYLVMLPEFPFLVEGRLDREAPGVVAEAFLALRALPEVEGRPTGAFGVSVGGGLLLIAAALLDEPARPDHVTVLGAYFDLDTYAASVAGRAQRIEGELVPWAPNAEVLDRLPPAVAMAMADPADQHRVMGAFSSGSYEVALAGLAGLSPGGRDVIDALSPASVWPRVAPPVFWIHDPNDDFEPLAEARQAERAPRDGRLVVVVPQLVEHAQVSESAGARGPLFVLGELWSLLVFTLEVLRIAG
ncbi:MAG: hypothetical protein ACRDGT_03805 [Candidatus Limnocylindria bacterium]